MATYKGNLMSKTPPTTSVAGAVGIWRSVDLMQAVYAGNWPPTYNPVTTDPYWPYVGLMLPGNGANNATNRTFVNSGASSVALTVTGNPAQGAATPYSSYWSMYSGGNAQYVRVPSATWTTFSGTFTLEFWVEWDVTPATGQSIGVSVGGGFTIYNDGTRITPNIYGTGNIFNSTFTPGSVVLGRWYHIAVVRNSSNVITMYVNGASVGSATYSSAFTQGAFDIFSPGNLNALQGCISNLRVTNTAVYTTTFTPPTAPLTAITGTQLLTCNANRFVDGSANNATLTVNGSVTVKAFNPFNFSASYSPTTNGGSLLGATSSDYINAAAGSWEAFGTGDFTVECWVYLNSTAANVIFSATGTSSWDVLVYANQLYWHENGGNLGGAGYGNVPLYAWTHLAISRASGTIRLFVNGAQVYSAANTYNYSNSTTVKYIGPYSNGTSLYVADVRVLNTTAAYAANFTPPTAPVSSTGASLLLKFNNAAIADYTMKNDLVTLANFGTSTAQSKYGGSSMYSATASDYGYCAGTADFAFGTGDFTVEFWMYQTNSSNNIIFSSATTNTWSVLTYLGTLYWQENGSNITGGSISLNTWTFVAISRTSGVLKIFIGGTQVYSAVNTFNSSNTTVNRIIGANGGNGGLYLNDVRITKGVGRYTTTFTPPAQALPTA